MIKYEDNRWTRDPVLRRTYINARAKVYWGFPREAVHRWVRRQPISLDDAEEMLDELFNERSNTVRFRGAAGFVFGFIVCLVGGYIMIDAVQFVSPEQSGSFFARRRHSTGMIVLFIGLFFFIKGLVALVTGEKKGSLSE